MKDLWIVQVPKLDGEWVVLGTYEDAIEYGMDKLKQLGIKHPNEEMINLLLINGEEREYDYCALD